MYKSRLPLLFFLLAFGATLSSCDAIVGIFKGGVWVGAIMVFVVVLLVWWLVGKARG